MSVAENVPLVHNTHTDAPAALANPAVQSRQGPAVPGVGRYLRDNTTQKPHDKHAGACTEGD